MILRYNNASQEACRESFLSQNIGDFSRLLSVAKCPLFHDFTFFRLYFFSFLLLTSQIVHECYE